MRKKPYSPVVPIRLFGAAVFFALAVMPAKTFAKGGIVTPFTPRYTTEDGRRLYVNPQPGIGRYSIAPGYGFRPVTSLDSYANRTLSYNNVAGSRVATENRTSGHVGPMFLSVNFELNPWLELSIPISYSRGWGQYVTLFDGVPTGESYYTIDSWFALLPSARLSWIRNNWFALYTRAGVGIALGNRYSDKNRDLDHGFAFAWHVSPVGVEFGRRVSFYVEGGYGFLGVVHGGVRFKLGRTDQNENDVLGAQKEWYEKYMKY